MTTIIKPIALLALFAGCASYPAPTQREVNTEAALAAAQAHGAQTDPRAAMQLRLAQEELASGRDAMNRGKNKRADFLLGRASADANLAIALAAEGSVRRDAEAAMNEARELKQREMQLEQQPQQQVQPPQLGPR